MARAQKRSSSWRRGSPPRSSRLEGRCRETLVTGRHGFLRPPPPSVSGLAADGALAARRADIRVLPCRSHAHRHGLRDLGRRESAPGLRGRDPEDVARRPLPNGSPAASTPRGHGPRTSQRRASCHLAVARRRHARSSGEAAGAAPRRSQSAVDHVPSTSGTQIAAPRRAPDDRPDDDSTAPPRSPSALALLHDSSLSRETARRVLRRPRVRSLVTVQLTSLLLGPGRNDRLSSTRPPCCSSSRARSSMIPHRRPQRRRWPRETSPALPARLMIAGTPGGSGLTAWAG